MHRLVFCCLIIISFSCPLLSLPIIDASEMSYQLSADEDSRLNLERLGSVGSTSLVQFLPELLGTLTEDNKAGFSVWSSERSSRDFCWLQHYGHKNDLRRFTISNCGKTFHYVSPHPGLSPSSYSPRENIKETFYGNHPRIALLGRFLTKDRKQYKKRGNLSECFWKYCV
ncbi:urotensin-2 [Phoenicopterus ruber ruber]